MICRVQIQYQVTGYFLELHVEVHLHLTGVIDFLEIICNSVECFTFTWLFQSVPFVQVIFLIVSLESMF